jgi:hypothetical protein
MWEEEIQSNSAIHKGIKDEYELTSGLLFVSLIYLQRVGIRKNDLV